MELIICEEKINETTPHHFLFSISRKYCTKFQATRSSRITLSSHVMVFLPYKACGPLTSCKVNVDQEEWPCTKKWMCWFFFMHVQKRQFYLKKKNSSLTILLSSLGLHLSSLLVRCVEDVACKSSHNNLFNERFNLYMFNVIYMWHVPLRCTLRIICNMLHHVYSNSWFPYVPHCLVKQLGVGWRGRAWKKWHPSWARYDQGTYSANLLLKTHYII